MHFRATMHGWFSWLSAETIEEAQKEADELIGDCTSDCFIDAGDEKHPVCRRKHWTVPFDPETADCDRAQIIDFGDSGYFEPWINEDSPVFIVNEWKHLSTVLPFFKNGKDLRVLPRMNDIGFARSGNRLMLITWGLNAKEENFMPLQSYVRTEDGTYYEKLICFIK